MMRARRAEFHSLEGIIPVEQWNSLVMVRAACCCVLLAVTYEPSWCQCFEVLLNCVIVCCLLCVVDLA